MTTPAGIIGEPLAQLREMLSQSAAFQAWTGTANAAAAAARVHWMFSSGDATAPYVVVDFGERHEVQNAGGSVAAPKSVSELVALFADEAEEGDDDAEALIKFTNTVGAILLEVFEQGGNASGYAPVLHLGRLHGPNITFGAQKQSEGKRRLQVAYSVFTGVGS